VAPLGVDAEVRNRGFEESVGGLRHRPQASSLDSRAHSVGVTQAGRPGAVPILFLAASVAPCPPGTQEDRYRAVRRRQSKSSGLGLQEKRAGGWNASG
jgi:hypothetical protein